MSFVLFFLGASIASCLNVIIKRSHHNQKYCFCRSECDNCGTKLNFNQLIPIISALYYQHTCPHCHKHFSKWHTLLEFSLGCCLFLLTYFFPLNYALWLFLLLTIHYFCSISDLLYLEIYFYPFCSLAFIWLVIGYYYFNLHLFLITFVIFLIIALFINYFFSNYLGSGDLFFLGFYFSFVPLTKIIIIIFIACNSCLLWALLKKQSQLPFIPFITLGFILTILLFS